jgi:cardiolipin synthase
VESILRSLFGSDLVTTLLPFVLQLVVAVFTSAHVVLFKRDVRAAIGWIGLIWLVPFGGAMLYALFGINRIRRRATSLRAQRPHARPASHLEASSRALLEPALPESARHLITLASLLDRITQQPLVAGNRIVPIEDGEAAYRQMMAAIDAAKETVGLSTYLFDNDAVGRRFIRALRRATKRGVAVRVLVDGVGARYSIPSAVALLRRSGVRIAEFLPTVFPLYMVYANLRTHRKILIVDGTVGFTGGMNIRAGHAAGEPVEASIRDVQFRCEGPVLAQFAETFVDDWAFCSGERLDPAIWCRADRPRGSALARGIATGPDEAFEQLRWAILGALSQAQRRVRVVTPYFVPDTTILTALSLASLRGVAIDIVLPERSNLRLVQWAAQAKLASLLARETRVWLTPPPFDHSKLMTVDGCWALFGSANWDQRSLRLNFEFNVECYEPRLVEDIDRQIDRRIAAASPLTHGQLAARPLLVKLRDGAAWLLSPYL